MQETQQKILSTFLSSRTSFLEVLLNAVLLAFGVNMVSGSLSEYFNLSNSISFYSGLILSIIPIIYFIVRLTRESYRTQIFEGVLSYNNTTKRIVTVREYYFSRITKSYLDKAIGIMPQTKNSWEDESNSLHNARDDDERDSIIILREVIEYFTLRELSLHLSDYFKNEKASNTQLFYRSDIRDISMNNRFLRLFTAPRLDLSSEHNDIDRDDPVITRVHKQHNNFVLTLPKSSRIYKENKNIVIDTRKFKILIEALFLGVNSEAPTGYHRYYLNLTRNDHVTDFSVGVKIDVSFKWWSFFLPSGLKYYRWLDSFLAKLEQNISAQVFFDTLQWQSIYPLIAYINAAIQTPVTQPSEPVSTDNIEVAQNPHASDS